MSNISINFLRQRHKELTILQKSDLRYAKILGYITAGVVISSLVLFVYQFYLSSNLENIRKQQNSVKNQIASLASVEEGYLTLAQKFTEIKTLIKDKALQQHAIEYFSIVFSEQQVIMTEVNREKDDVLSFRIQAPDVFVMQKALNFLQSTEVLTAYPSLTLSNLSRQKSGMYSTTVSIRLPKDTPTPAARNTPRPLSN
jgi:competence CoiA-like predicted nuclease